MKRERLGYHPPTMTTTYATTETSPDAIVADFILGIQQAGFVVDKCESEILFYRPGNHKMQTTAKRLMAMNAEQTVALTVAATIAVYDRHSDETV